MNIKKLIINVGAITATASSLAQEYTEPEPFVGTKTRAEVIAELEHARRNGTFDALNAAYPVFISTPSTKTRDEVNAELAEAGIHGTLEVQEDVYPVIVPVGQSKTRDQVRAELQEFQRSHPREGRNSI